MVTNRYFTYKTSDKKYKYTLQFDVDYETGIYSERGYTGDYLEIDWRGRLTILTGYSWDGLTGFIDVPDAIEASLVHDALYQLIREKVLPKSYRKRADKIFKEMCINNGVHPTLASTMYRAVRLFGWAFI